MSPCDEHMADDGKGGVSKICLFVRNIPYSTTDCELEEAFKPYGPLRACYTVKEKGAFKCQIYFRLKVGRPFPIL